MKLTEGVVYPLQTSRRIFSEVVEYVVCTHLIHSSQQYRVGTYLHQPAALEISW